VKKSNNGFWLLVLIGVGGYLLWDSGYLDRGHSLGSIEDTTCRDIQEDAIGDELSNGTDTFKIIDIRNSKEISRSDSKLVCIGELMYEGRSGNELRMEYSIVDNKSWIRYEVQ
jgi:hypothetical protein